MQIFTIRLTCRNKAKRRDFNKLNDCEVNSILPKFRCQISNIEVQISTNSKSFQPISKSFQPISKGLEPNGSRLIWGPWVHDPGPNWCPESLGPGPIGFWVPSGLCVYLSLLRVGLRENRRLIQWPVHSFSKCSALFVVYGKF